MKRIIQNSATTSCNGIAPTKCENVYTFSVNETSCNGKHNRAGTVSARRWYGFLPIIVLSFAFLMMANTQEAKADPWWYHYEVSTKLNPATCCVEITVTHPWGGLANFDVAVKRLDENGNWVIVDNGPVYADPRPSERTTIICPEDGEDVVWKVEVDISSIPHSTWFFVASGTITADEIAKCKQSLEVPTSCEDIDGCMGVDWHDVIETIHLPNFPNCTITYKYQTRHCGDETQIRGVTISFNYGYYGGDCRGLLVSLVRDGETVPLEGPINTALIDFNKVQKLFDDVFRKLTRDLFEEYMNSLASKVPPNVVQNMLGCDEIQHIDVVTSYYRGKCVSYCASTYLDENNEWVFEFKEDNCESEQCCRTAVSYCLDENGEIVTRETREEVDENDLPCDPPTQYPSCRPGMFNSRSDCLPNCE